LLIGANSFPGGRPKRLMKLIETIQQKTRDGKELVDFMLVTFPLRSDAVTSASDDYLARE